jgi:(p)ppGpp synthase/HD superfamily hydrolase
MKYTPLIEKAIQTAAILHQGQIRKNSYPIPYITHPFAVALILSSYFDCENLIIAGLLHDTIEDSEYTPEELEKDFGKKVRDIVMGVTEKKNDHSENKLPWKVRKESYIKNLENDSEESLLLCAADKIHNMSTVLYEYQTVGPDFLKNFNCTPEEKAWYNQEVLNVLERKLKDKRILEEFKRLLEETKKLSISLN